MILADSLRFYRGTTLTFNADRFRVMGLFRRKQEATTASSEAAAPVEKTPTRCNVLRLIHHVYHIHTRSSPEGCSQSQATTLEVQGAHPEPHLDHHNALRHWIIIRTYWRRTRVGERTRTSLPLYSQN